MKKRFLRFHEAHGGKSFVGIKYCENTIEFYYPESYRWDSEVYNGKEFDFYECLPDVNPDISCGIKNILSSIEMAKTKSNEKSCLYDTFVSDESFALKSYIWIIGDFMRNGYYKNIETIFKMNQTGRINWKRTFKNQPVEYDGSYIYKDIVVSAKSKVDNDLVEIYRFCVQKSIFLIGWLYNLNLNSFGIKEYKDIELDEKRKKQFVFAIKSEMNHTFDDGKRLRLTNMLNIITGLNKSNNGQLVYGVDSYHYVFEQMINEIYGTENTTKYNPKGIWHFEVEEKESSSLEPDTIMIHNNICVIIDSKCYRYAFDGFLNNTSSGLPSTESIQKQLTYGDSVKKNFEGIVYNCFVLPYKNKENLIKYSGVYATGGWRDNDSDFEKIYVIFADMKNVVETWNSIDHEKERNDLVKLLDDCAR